MYTPGGVYMRGKYHQVVYLYTPGGVYMGGPSPHLLRPVEGKRGGGRKKAGRLRDGEVAQIPADQERWQ